MENKDEIRPSRDAKLNFGADNILRIELDLNCDPGKEIEARVGAYGMLEWGKNIIDRHFTITEMRRQKALAQEESKKGILRPN